MKTRVLLFLALIIILPAGLHGQVGNFIRNKAGRAVNAAVRATDRETDKAIDTAVTKAVIKKENEVIEKETNKDQGNEGQTAPSGSSSDRQTSRQSNRSGGGFNLGGLMGGKADIKHNEDYSFDGRIYMQMETYDKKDVSKMDYYIYFNSNSANAGIEFKSITTAEEGSKPGATVMVYDNDNRCFIMLLGSSDSKSGIISTMPSDSAMQAQAKAQSDKNVRKPVITKTGNTRTIAGYKCDEYKVVDPEKDGYGMLWMSKDVVIKADRRNWGKSGLPSFYNNPDFEGGMILAMESYDKNNKLEMKTETKEINQKFSHEITTKDYNLMKMNFMQAGTGKK
jgi:hypothetical protein